MSFLVHQVHTVTELVSQVKLSVLFVHLEGTVKQQAWLNQLAFALQVTIVLLVPTQQFQVIILLVVSAQLEGTAHRVQLLVGSAQ